MRKFTLILFLFFSISAFTQVPPAFNYQSVIRNSEGKLLPSQLVGTRFSILQNTPDGEIVYSEFQQAETNENGLLTLIIGFGETQDEFSEIDWNSGPYYIKVETDPAGGSNYTIESTALLTSVPYALQSLDSRYANAVFTENEAGKFVGYLGIGTNSGGYFTIGDKNAESVATAFCADDSLGIFYTQSSSGRVLNELSFTSNGGDAGFIGVYGKNNSLNVALSCLEGNVNRGFLAVKDENDVSQAGIYVNENGQGVIFADVKNFSIPHPNDKTKTINYASLEGPEAAVYLRGTASLTNGVCTIYLPEHFGLVGSNNNITVLVTPLSAASKGLAVSGKSISEITVQELFDGSGNYEFDYEIKTVRKGYESYQVLRDPLKVLDGNTKSAVLKSNVVLKSAK